MQKIHLLALFGACAVSVAGCSVDDSENPGPVAVDDATTGDATSDGTSAETSGDTSVAETAGETGTSDTGAADTARADATDGGAADAADTSVADASSVDAADTSTADAADASDSAEAAVSCAVGGDAGDAGAICPAGQWRNNDTNACVACPAAATLTCGNDGISGAIIDMNARKMTLTLAKGKLQPVSGTVTLVVTDTPAYCSGVSGPIGATKTVLVPVVPNGDTLVADLSTLVAEADAGSTFAVPCGTHTLVVRDACCVDHTVQFVAQYESESQTTYNACPVIASDAGTDGD